MEFGVRWGQGTQLLPPKSVSHTITLSKSLKNWTLNASYIAHRDKAHTQASHFARDKCTITVLYASVISIYRTDSAKTSLTNDNLAGTSYFGHSF